MKWIKYQIHTKTADSEMIGELLCEIGIAGFEISDHVPLSSEEEAKMYTDIPATLPPDDGLATLTFYTEVPGEEAAFYSTGSSLRDARLEEATSSAAILPPDELIGYLQDRIRKMQEFVPISLPDISYSIEDDSQWKDKWKENFKPFRIAEDILIKPTWEEIPKDSKPNDIILQIDPGSAFGTGTHETTKLCLLSLRKYLKKDTRILDAGCGSGILAIAAILCGAKSAFCLDIDPAAVSGTLENAKINKIDHNKLHAIHANILEDASAIQKQTGTEFDIAVANILADVIVPLSDRIGSFIKPGGLFISSGILAEKAEEVKNAIERNHFQIIEKNEMGDWVSFVAKKRYP